MKEYSQEEDSCCRPERSQPPTASPSDILALGEMGTLRSGLRVCVCVCVVVSSVRETLYLGPTVLIFYVFGSFYVFSTF